ncbi:MAG: choice-of-anchor E domain-containing protein [Planctomycetota bacterium]
MTKSAIAVAAVVATAGATQALSIEVANETIPTQNTDIGPLNFSFDEFGALGLGPLAVLTGVEIFLEGTISGNGTITNNSTEDLTAQLALDGEVSVSTNVSGLGTFELAKVLPTLSNGVVTLTQGQSDTVGPGSDTDNTTGNWTAGASVLDDTVIAEFAGNGTQSVSFLFDGEFNANASSTSGQTDTTITSTVQGAGSFRVVYIYEIIPTPGSAALLGVAGLAAARRRRA